MKMNFCNIVFKFQCNFACYSYVLGATVA